MKIDEAIKHAEEVAEENSKSHEEWLACKNRGNVGWSKSDIEAVDKSIEQCKKCAEEHRQLAEWLKDYQRLLEEQHVDDAKKHFEIICKLSQACGMPYSFVEEKIRETEKALLKALPQEPCDDCISRQAVNELVDELARAISDERCCISRGRSTATIMRDILHLPPVTPQTKPNIKALGEDIRICQKSITDKKVLIGFNMAVALCNKHLTESEEEE